MLKNINPSTKTRFLAIHYISGIGKCSITGGWPILPAGGI